MATPKLSIIVPIYNVEPYLRKCVESLLTQDLDPAEYEIILVDDGSTDSCPAICDEYAQTLHPSGGSRKGANIKVIHQPNGGLSAARNTGIMAAKGDYVCFVDSDDYWESNVLGGLMAQVERDNLDVLRFKWQNVNDAYEVFNPNKSNPYRLEDYSSDVTTGEDFLNTRFGYACYAVQFIIRRSLLVGSSLNAKRSSLNVPSILFTPGIHFEDTDWTPRMLLAAQRVASTDTMVYDYLVREGSITHAVNMDKQRKVLNDKLRLVATLVGYKQLTPTHTWLNCMIAATVVSIMGILAVDFWSERHQYINQLKSLAIFPLSTQRTNKFAKRKIRLLNISPILVISLLHIKHVMLDK